MFIIGVEIIGLSGSLLILVSMLYKSNTHKGNIAMRVWNLIGSIIFVVYGCLLPAYSTIILNVIMIILHIYHLVLLLREGDNNEKQC